ncbi:MAG: PfkB family carbohydrate kinase [Candidatus Gastranaerophilales bacterium]|nr:PfkB family carbohydrate kinase [Candidatus Gastranaerophilales bacterium]
MKIDKKRISEVIENLITPRVLVIGDLALDEMVYGQTARISREAPVLILKHSETKIILGAGSNAAHNISALNDGKVSTIGIYGRDYHAPVLLNTLKKANIDTSLMVEDINRPTTTKTRISGFSVQSVRQQIVRIDREMNTPVSKETEDKIIANIEVSVPDFDAVVLSDYDIGVMTPRIIECAINTAKKHNKIITVDTQKDLNRFKGVTCLTPNQPDAEKATGYLINSYDKAIEAGQDLIDITEAKMMLLTRGDEGMIVFDGKDTFHSVSAFNKTDVFDVTGAGDTVIAAFTLALAAGASAYEAAIVGNLAASLVIRYFGCATTSRQELIKSLNELNVE